MFNTQVHTYEHTDSNHNVYTQRAPQTLHYTRIGSTMTPFMYMHMLHLPTHPHIQACPHHMHSHTRQLQLTLCWQGGLHLLPKFLCLCITVCCTGNVAVCPQGAQCCILLQVLKQKIPCFHLICILNLLY